MHGIASNQGRRWTRTVVTIGTVLALALALVGAPASANEPDDPGAAAQAAQAAQRAHQADRWDLHRTGEPTSMDLVNQAIGADKLHRGGIDGSGVGVAMVDTGVVPVDGLLTPGKVVEGPDLSFESQAPGLLHLDTFGHGTHLAGIIAGDGTDFTGVAPGSQLVSLKVATHDGGADVTQVIAAIDWVVQHRDELGVRVLNLAYGTDSTQDYTIDPLSYAIENAWHKGIVVVVSAGNEGRGIPLNNPATNPYVIAVGASDTRQTPGSGDDVAPEFSSIGTDRTVDILAPGQSVVSLRNPGSWADVNFPNARVGDRFFRGTGSSQAAAVVSGAAALLLQERPDLSPDEVKALLTASASKLHDAGVPAGSLDVHRASRSAPPDDATQDWPLSTGLGSIEASRGTSHVADDGIELIGEQDIFGDPWDGRSWTELTWNGRSWTGGDWLGRSWTGDTWSADSWTGRSWTGRSWTGRSWTGRSWTGRSWTGRSWTGRSWTGGEWGMQTWTGRSWTGRSWTASRTWI
jgi:serine protease AprX